ncbi:MAG: hypothetical protein JSW65_03690, partial [Candidatus Bipolaricaulota bacterium]
ALAAAVEMTRADPEQAFALFLQANPELDDELSLRSFEATLPLFAKGLRHDDRELWAELQAFLFDNGLIASSLPLEDLFTAVLLP